MELRANGAAQSGQRFVQIHEHREWIREMLCVYFLLFGCLTFVQYSEYASYVALGLFKL